VPEGGSGGDGALLVDAEGPVLGARARLEADGDAGAPRAEPGAGAFVRPEVGGAEGDGVSRAEPEGGVLVLP